MISASETTHWRLPRLTEYYIEQRVPTVIVTGSTRVLRAVRSACWEPAATVIAA